VEAQADIPARQAPPRRRLPGSSAFGGRSERGIAQLLIAPGQLLLLFLVAFPAGVAIYISFTDYTATTSYPWYDAYKGWIWFDNYWEALSSGGFWSAIWRTVIVTVLAVGIEFALGLILAFLFLKEFRARGVVMVVFLLPMMVVPAVAGFIFYMIFQTDGPVNAALTFFLDTVLGVTGPISVAWLSDPGIALYSVIMADIWQWTPLMFLIFLSGLVALPEDQLNQARILGAGFWHQLRYLILPMMKPIILIALIIRTIEVFKIFDAAWLLTRGGPGDATTTISIYLYRQINENYRYGYASAAAIIVLIIVSIFAIRAIRPIEAAQEETFEELVTSEEVTDGLSVEDAVAVESRI
jgi:multiple sugar transport system permease protein